MLFAPSSLWILVLTADTYLSAAQTVETSPLPLNRNERNSEKEEWRGKNKPRREKTERDVSSGTHHVINPSRSSLSTFRTASYKSWAWRLGNQASSVIKLKPSKYTWLPKNLPTGYDWDELHNVLQIFCRHLYISWACSLHLWVLWFYRVFIDSLWELWM